VKDLIDEIIAEEFASPDLELHWLDEDASDTGKAEAAFEGRLKIGTVTLNEVRSHLGLDPYANPAADRPMVLTATGYVPIEANAEAGGEGESAESNKQSNTEGVRANTPSTSAVQKYNPDQPRVPAGNPDGGEWTKETEEAAAIATTTAHVDEGNPRISIAVSRPGRTATDANTDLFATGERYATTLVIKHPDAWTGDPEIDATTDKLITILEGVMETIEHTPGLSPQKYGQLVHQAFATAVRSAGIPGIGPNDVETTFPDGRYASPDSIRTDVIKSQAGKIVAIYDVKTGESGLTEGRIDKLLATTKAPPDTFVIELRFRGSSVKY
jgi:hypothetical protein